MDNSFISFTFKFLLNQLLLCLSAPTELLFYIYKLKCQTNMYLRLIYGKNIFLCYLKYLIPKMGSFWVLLQWQVDANAA